MSRIFRRQKKFWKKFFWRIGHPGDRSEMVVFVDQLADSAVIMGLRVWVPTDSYWSVKWRLNQKIKEEFDAQGIVIPYNQMDIYVHHKD